jgi:hypothetical protein
VQPPQENTAHGKMKTQIHSHTSLPFEIDFKRAFESLKLAFMVLKRVHGIMVLRFAELREFQHEFRRINTQKNRELVLANQFAVL